MEKSPLSQRKSLLARAGVRSVLETLEPRRLMSADIQSFDGTGNNLANPDWGSTGVSQIRLAAANYADGVSTPNDAALPSARAISNAVAAHGDEEVPSETNLSAFAYLWGQFIDHDLDLTNSGEPSEVLSIAVPTGDPYFDPAGTGTQTIDITRSKYADGTGVTTPRAQVNDITAFLDGSMVYGSDDARAAALRTFVGGTLKTSAGDLLPFNSMGLDNATLGGPDDAYFAAGDIRANENVELTTMHALWVREHNRLAAEIAQSDPSLSDEAIYQKARRTVIAEIQAITYNEFLPSLLGPDAIARYRGYQSDVNPAISTEFSTAAFRFGHSMLPDDVEFFDEAGNPTREEISLSEAFFNPSIIAETGLDPILKYLASSNSEEIDTQVVDGLRNFLFGPPGSGGLDLVSMNIERGRDHGLAGYNATRVALGLPAVTSFSQITSDVAMQTALQSLYGSVDNVELWVGGLAEDHAPGSNVGQTFQAILVDQFTRIRDGDRFWYQNVMGRREAQRIGQTTLADVIRRNTGVQNIQPNVFVFEASISGRVWEDRNGNGRINRRERGVAGQSVSLVDAEGAVVQTVETDGRGVYRFGDLELGEYTLQLGDAQGWQFEPVSAGPVLVTRGGRVDGIDVAATRTAATPAPATGTLPTPTGPTPTAPAPVGQQQTPPPPEQPPRQQQSNRQPPPTTPLRQPPPPPEAGALAEPVEESEQEDASTERPDRRPPPPPPMPESEAAGESEPEVEGRPESRPPIGLPPPPQGELPEDGEPTGMMPPPLPGRQPPPPRG